MRKLIVLLCFLLTLSLAFPVAAASDLPKSHMFYDEINYLIERNVLNGYPDGTMHPDSGVTRAEAVMMIGRLKGFDGKQQNTIFSDVPSSHKASGYIAAAAKAKLINGYPDGTYRPNNTITRAEMAFILSRLFVVPFRADVSFTDISPDMAVFEPIQQILAANITIGYPNKTFRPNVKVTRGQFSAFLARGLEAKFKNRATISNSYLRDKTKSYSYDTEYGAERHVYNYVPSRYGLEMGFVWSIYKEDRSLLTDTLEFETHESYIFGMPYSEAYTELIYPIKIGQAWYTDTEYSAPRVITKTNVTVHTPFKTFTNAVEVTVAANPQFSEKGHVYYMVEGYGEVKSVNLDGTVTKELVAVE